MVRVWGVSWLVVLLGCVLGVPTALAAADSPLPSRADVPGYRVAGGGVQVAGTAVSGSLPATLRQARTSGAAFRSGSVRLTFGVFELSSQAAARRALNRLRPRRRRVNVGTVGWERVGSTRHTTDIAVVFQVGAAIGAVRFRTRPASARGNAPGLNYARWLAKRLRRVLALTAWQRTLDGIGNDGSITPKLALQAFSLAYGPLPAVSAPPAGAAGGAPPEPTLAMQMVARVWNRLTAAQHAAVDRALGAPHDAGSAPVAQRAAQVLTPDPRLQSIADGYSGMYRTRLPGAPAVTIKVFDASAPIPNPKPHADTLADALPVNASGQWGVGPVGYCRVRIAPAGRKLSASSLDVTLAHEAFHCYQFALNPNWPTLAEWILEGSADWAALSVDPVASSVQADNYRAYLADPTTVLFARSYDANGFWGHADEVGGRGSLWSKLPGVLTAPNDVIAYQRAGGDASAFVDTWASAVWRLPGAGDPWRQTDPLSLSSAEFSGLDPTIVEGDVPLSSSPYALSEYVVHPAADLPLVEVTNTEGSLRAGTSQRDFGLASTAWFCAGKCECPSGEQSSIPNHESISHGLALALTGGESAGSGSVVFHSLEEFCKPTGAQGIQVLGKPGEVFATFRSGTCTVAKGQFHATAKDGAWSIDIRIRSFTDYAQVYTVRVGGDPSFVIKGPGGPYANANPPPNHAPAFGEIHFYPGGKKMTFGFEYAWNADGSNAVLPLGVMTCKRGKR